MKKCAVLILLLAAAACQPAATATPASPTPEATIAVVPSSTPMPSPTDKPTETEPEPVYVLALCTLMGQEVRSDFPAGHPAIVYWGWAAATEEQVGEYIRVSQVVVTFDGVEIFGQQQGGIRYDETDKKYKAVWTSTVGIPKLGIHTISFFLTFSEKLSDGWDYFGPGTENEKLEDKCEIDVK